MLSRRGGYARRFFAFHPTSPPSKRQRVVINARPSAGDVSGRRLWRGVSTTVCADAGLVGVAVRDSVSPRSHLPIFALPWSHRCIGRHHSVCHSSLTFSIWCSHVGLLGRPLRRVQCSNPRHRPPEEPSSRDVRQVQEGLAGKVFVVFGTRKGLPQTQLRCSRRSFALCLYARQVSTQDPTRVPMLCSRRPFVSSTIRPWRWWSREGRARDHERGGGVWR